MSPTLAILRQESRLLAVDPTPLITLFAMPIGSIFFLHGVLGDALGGPNGMRHVGANQAVPGFALTYGFFGSMFVVYSFFREHYFSTWPRLRSAATRRSILAGKLLPWATLVALQLNLILASGPLVWSMSVPSSFVALEAIVFAYAALVTAFGLLLVSCCRTMHQASAAAFLAAGLLGGLGGVVAPLQFLPSWVRFVAVATPHYWAMDAFGRLLAGEAGVGDVLGQIAVLAAYATAVFAVALLRFRPEEAKVVF